MKVIPEKTVQDIWTPILYANLFQLRNYIEAHVTEIKQLQDARKGTAPFIGNILKEVMEISGSLLYSLTNYNTNDTVKSCITWLIITPTIRFTPV
jgi:hypothetical protein